MGSRLREGSGRAHNGIPRSMESRRMLNSAERSISAEMDSGEGLVRGVDGQQSRRLNGVTEEGISVMRMVNARPNGRLNVG